MRRLIRLVRTLAVLLVAAAAILAGILAFNVVSHGSRQLQVAAVPRGAVDQQGAAARLGEAIRFRTISNFQDPDQDAAALRGLQTHIAASFPAFHAAAKREVVAPAALEPGQQLRMRVFLARLGGSPSPAGEIARLHWWRPEDSLRLAPAIEQHVIPALTADGMIG